MLCTTSPVWRIDRHGGRAGFPKSCPSSRTMRAVLSVGAASLSQSLIDEVNAVISTHCHEVCPRALFCFRYVAVNVLLSPWGGPAE
jgi:hypothetical protein